MGLTIIYVVAVLVSIVFERQERRHQFELWLEYDRLGKTLLPSKPKLSLTVSWLNVFVGGVLLVLGASFLLTAFSMLRTFGNRLTEVGSHIGPQFEMAAVTIATSISLIFLGLKSVQQNRRLGEGRNQNSAP